MNYYILALLPVISAFIGWFTNYIAVKMLFHPRLPRRFAGITIQGIFPKRQLQFAQKLGKLVSTELLSFDEIAKTIANPDNLAKLNPAIEEHIDGFLRERLVKEMPIIGAFLGDKTIEKVKGLFLQELNNLFPTLMNNYTENLKHELDLEAIVVEKVSNFSSDKLEEILLQIMSKEFRFIELIGAVLGFLIGAVQVLITLLAT